MRTPHTPALPAYLRHSTLVAALGIALAPLASTAAIQSYTVTTGADGGTGSLREILTTINNDMNCSIDDYAINFSGPFTIAPSIPLPALQCPRTTINANDMAGVVIDGINYSYGGTCVLDNTSSGVAVIKKLRLQRFNFAYGSITGICGQVHALGNSLANMALGMDLSGGSLADGNTLDSVDEGISIFGAGTLIRNTVTYLGFQGIYAEGDMYGGRPTVDSNVVYGGASAGFNVGIAAYQTLDVKNNGAYDAYIGISVNGAGLQVAGNTVIGNSYGGIVADNGAIVEGNFVGGNETGIYSNDVTLRGNFVGTFGGRLGNQIGIADTSAGIGSIIEDNFVSGNSTTGIYLDGFGGIVRGNRIGTNEAGTAALPNDGPGIFVTRYAFDYQISGNTISGNNNAGIFVEADGLGLSITDNRIGTNSAGSGGLGNATMGIDLPCGGAEISIKGNTISGNGSHGVWLGGVTGDPTSGSIENNYIGTASGGGGLIPNGGNGVTLAMLLGGATCSPPALQAAKAGSAKTRQQQAKMERKALSAATAKALQPKALQPKALNMSATNFVPVVGNTIKNNVGSGIEVRDDGQGNHWFANSISANRVKNIDLNGGAALANDDGDIDAGNNLKQNYAEIVSVQQTAANTTEISFTLKSESADTVGCPTTPPASGYVYRIDFYTNPSATTPAGDNPLIAANTFLPGAPCGGVVSGGYTLNGHYDFISLTTHNESTSNSSEFSNVMAAVAAPAVAFNPALPVSFGQVPMFGSASRTVTLTSVGGQPWRFTSFSTDANCGRLAAKAAVAACTAPFSCDTTCVAGTDVPNGGSCTLSATFAPTATGSTSQTIYLCDNAHTAGHPVTLTGEGLPAAVATVTPSTWNFGSVRVGQKSAFKSFSVVNENPVATTIQAITTSGDFVRESTTCPTAPATLAAGQGCEVVVSFLPAVAGAANGTLRLSSGGGGLSDATAALQGNGTQVAEISLPSSVDFGTYTLGAAPIVRSITITNTGNTDVVFSGISASAPWTLTHGCGTQLAPNASCTFSLGFAPSTAGAYTGNLTVSSNAQGSGSVALSGTAQEAPVPLATLSSNTIDLGSVPVGTTSNPGSITLTSTGTAPYVISKYSSDSSCSTAASVCTSGEFLCSLGCNPGQSYVAGSSCTISARFAPQSVGPRSTTFFICDNTTASPRAVTIKGQGSNPLVVGLAPAAHDFGVVPVGQSSPAQTFTIVNSSGGTVTISAPFASANFRVLSHTCPASLGPSQRCSAEVAFVPTLAGALSGQLVIQTSGAGTASAFANLTGVGGTQPVLDLTSALDFGSVQAGSGTVTRTATVTNTGNAPLSLSSVTLTGTFYALQNECPATVAAGASCSIRVTFTPTESGEFNGTLTVVGNVSGGPRTVALTGRAQPRPVPLVRVNPANMGFGDRQIGSQSAAQRITVSNVGGAAAAIDSITVGPDYVVAANNCGSALAAQQSCIIELALRPVGFGPRVGQLQVFTNSDGSPHTVNLTGTGCRPFTPGSRNNNGRNAACAP